MSVSPTVFEITVSDPQESDEAWKLLNALHDGRTRIFAGLQSECRRLDNLADDLLTALGKDFELPGVARNAHRKWDYVRAWLRGEPVSDLFIWGFEGLDPL